MGFWKKLFGLEKKIVPLDLNAKDADKDGKVQEGTIWERPADFKVNSAEDIAKLLEDNKKPAKKAPAKKPAAKKSDAPKKAPAKKPAAKTTKKTGTGAGGKSTKQAR